MIHRLTEADYRKLGVCTGSSIGGVLYEIAAELAGIRKLLEEREEGLCVRCNHWEQDELRAPQGRCGKFKEPATLASEGLSAGDTCSAFRPIPKEPTGTTGVRFCSYHEHWEQGDLSVEYSLCHEERCTAMQFIYKKDT